MLQFISPPMPHFIIGGQDTYPVNGKHADRTGIGVFDLLIVTRGTLYMAEESLPLTVPAGHFALLRPDRSHRTTQPCREETHFYWLHFQTLGNWNETDSEDFHPTRTNDVYPTIQQFAFYLPQLGRLQSPDSTYSQLIQLLELQADTSALSLWKQQVLFQELLLQFQEETNLAEGNSYLAIADRAATLLRRKYKDEINYRTMSEQLHFHANYISLCMKRAYGCTPLEYLTQFRVEQAKRLLIHTNETVGRIAEETGFGSFPYFVRCFGRLTGTTPKAYRMQFRKAK